MDKLRTKAVPKYGEVLVAISNGDPSNIDAADQFAFMHQDFFQREVLVRDDRIRRERQQLLHSFPDPFWRPAFPLLMKKSTLGN